MICRRSILLLCLVACLSACRRNQPSENRQVTPPVSASTPSIPQNGGDAARTASVVTPDGGVGILALPDGSKFVTTLYDLKMVGQLRTARKLPYYILSGRGCRECDANISIYIHSPSDGSMKNEGEQRRFSYPGREANYEDRSPVYDARMFFGDCAVNHPNAVVWFERWLADDKQWHEGVSLAEVKDDNLVYYRALNTEIPKLSDVQEFVNRGQCQELPGIDSLSEP